MSDSAFATRRTDHAGLCHRVGEVAKGKGLEVTGPNVWSDGIAANQGSNSGENPAPVARACFD